jgi:hypothetical protein
MLSPFRKGFFQPMLQIWHEVPPDFYASVRLWSRIGQKDEIGPADSRAIPDSSRESTAHNRLLHWSNKAGFARPRTRRWLWP